MGKKRRPLEELTALHSEVVRHVAEVVRWGYMPATDSEPERVGKSGDPIVRIDGHAAFVDALLVTRQAGLSERRRPVRLFTTNYDTLLEDALALACIPCWDGFSGGAVAFRNHRFGQETDEKGARATLVKLHGSIDWHQGEDGKVWRVREGDTYPVRASRVLIYPQATKYHATQRDPFAAQFELLRRALTDKEDNILAVCGYSFGDEHINQEVEQAMARPESKTTLFAFCWEGGGLPAIVERWRRSPWGRRLYVMTEKGLYVGGDDPQLVAEADTPHDWWSFAGVTKLLRDGIGEYA